MFLLLSILTNKHNRDINERFWSCIKHYSILPSDINLDIVLFAKHLLNIKRNIKDLLDPFQKGYYYNKAMGGSFSIKSVLPAIFPDDPTLNYHNLDGVHNGAEAMTIFPLIKNMPIKEQETARKNLLKYCELDTFAMVKIWQELIRSINS